MIPDSRGNAVSIPSEMIERAAHAVYATRWGDHPPSENDAVFEWAESIAQAALEAALQDARSKTWANTRSSR